MELQEIMELWDRFDRSKVEEMEIDINDVHFRLKRSAPVPIISAAPPAALPASSAVPEQDPAAPAADSGTEGNVIRSPLAGTFYRSASPQDDAFVSVGSQVQKGDVIGIVEAMKLFNEVQATEDGIVREILAEDGELVEYNQVLIVLE